MQTNHSTKAEPPDVSITLQINVSEIGPVPEALAAAFSRCSAEAQMLEHSIKSAITKDIHVFAAAGDQISFLEILEKMTLGNAKHVAFGTSSKKDIDACVGFFDLVKMQWHANGRPEPELKDIFKDAVTRRNRLAHQLLAEVLRASLSVEDALAFLKESQQRFFEVRSLVVTADALSSKMGSVATNGDSLPRFKTTS